MRQVVCVQESPKPGSDDMLVEDDKCEGVKPASREICDSHVKCRSPRFIDNIPKQLLKDVWRQINRGASKRELVSKLIQILTLRMKSPTIHISGLNLQFMIIYSQVAY